MVSCALSSACGCAAFSLMPDDAAVLAIEFKINLIAPARRPRFRFEGLVIKPGRAISITEDAPPAASTTPTRPAPTGS